MSRSVLFSPNKSKDLDKNKLHKIIKYLNLHVFIAIREIAQINNFSLTLYDAVTKSIQAEKKIK